MRTESGGYRRDHLCALAQRVEVDRKELRIMGSKSVLLRTLVAASSAKTAGFGVPCSVPKWRARRDSNSQPSDSKSDAQRFHGNASDFKSPCLQSFNAVDPQSMIAVYFTGKHILLPR
jgi:hypothetical protein